MRRNLMGLALLVTAVAHTPATANVALLLFDGEKGKTFVGCLNCNRFDDASVCNQFGDYGSKFSDKSIWNQFGEFGSQFETNSPWNTHGEGLRVVDAAGNYYGRFTLATYEQSRVPLVAQIIAAHKAVKSLDKLQEIVCGR